MAEWTNLIVLPADPKGIGGYNQVSAHDLRRWNDGNSLIVVYDDISTSAEGISRFIKIRRNSLTNKIEKILNILRLIPASSLKAYRLKRLIRGEKFTGQIYCGDTVCYYAIRSLFPDREIVVRFHNFFSLQLIRVLTSNFGCDLYFLISAFAFWRLEKTILNDKNVKVEALGFADQVAMSLVSQRYVSQINDIHLKFDGRTVELSKVKRLVYIGSAQSHQFFGIRFFIDNIFYEIRQKFPNVVLELYGVKTSRFDNRAKGVYGFGFTQRIPDFDEFTMFVVPDFYGGGVKIKVSQLFDSNKMVLCTPSAIEGYSYGARKGFIVAPIDEWIGILNEVIE